MMGPYGSFGGGMSWGGWVAMAFAFVVFWGLVAALIVLLVRSAGHHHELALGPAGSSSALHILEERFARGEVDADEYARRRQLLSPS
jgi:putative membrane protein